MICSQLVRVKTPVKFRTRSGSQSQVPIIVAAQLTYTCNAGYQLRGNGQRFCQPPGQWTGSQPTCVPSQGIHKTNTSGYFYRAYERNNTLPNNRICIHISTKLNICQKEKINTLCVIITLKSSKKFQ